ncbi:MAG: S9 family peptidase [Ilumatobacter sp.]|uniref:S9 family peptidase n=1 Tax=Ilumatobacter sp. TaxID=1967498 RepID=UPI0026362BD6|nr:S9 family peptidase [Ilumatobacter sp.]MDJ0768412.1 S9 family peptidase [Ilumatobacter sp.]
MPDTETPSRHAEIARDLIHLRSAVGQPKLSPDGRHVAAVVATVDLDENTTRTRVWLDGAPVTAGPRDSQPTWSPDGRWLAFTSRRDDDSKKPTLHVMPVHGPGEVRTVCTMPDGLGELAWSPDGRWLGFLSRTRDSRYDAKDATWQSPRKIERFLSRLNGENWIFDRPQHVYVVAADGTGQPRNLTEGEFAYGGFSWLADSSGVVASGTAHETWDEDAAEDLYVVPLDGEIRALTQQTGKYVAPAVSPDGRQVAFMGLDNAQEYPQNAKIGLVDVDGGEHRWISTGLDRTFFAMACPQAPVWETSDTLLAVAEDRGDTHLYRLHVDGRAPEPITDGPTTVQGYDVAGDVIATTRSDVTHGGELWITRAGDDEQLTHVAGVHRGWEKFTVTCTDGSDDIDAWIMRPDDFDPDQRYPLLLNVHGGPFTQYGEYFFDEAQMQAAAGFVVLMSNPRGGSGRHTAWGQAIMGPKHPTAPGTGWGSVDVDDVIAVLDATLDRYTFCDPERVGMLGGSYGGYMATTLAARYGDRFVGICSERAVNNLLTEEWSSDVATFFRAEHGPTVVEDPGEYTRMSPITMAHDIHVPMLIIHSEDDFRCPINQAEELWVTLKLLKRDVTFYRFPSENHELSRSGSPVHRRMRAEIILDWFADLLLPADDTDADATTEETGSAAT